MFLRFLTFF